MSIAIFGVGGAGGYFGARLVQAGHDTVFIARGEHLAAIRDRGLTVATDAETFVVHPRIATDDPARAGKASVVILGVKSWQVEDAARAMRPMIGRDTFVLPLQNGVEAASRLTGVLGASRVVGGMCGTISRLDGPGHVRSVGGMNFIRFGELDRRVRARTRRLRQSFADAGIAAEIPEDIDVAVWQKFLFVVPLGGVGAFASATIGTMRSQPELRAMLSGAMAEIHALARKRGIALPDDTVSTALAFMDGLAAEGTSSLQRDLAAGVPSELEDWTGAVVRLGRESGVATPIHDTLYAKLKPIDTASRARFGVL